MKTITLTPINVPALLVIVEDLKQQGWKIGKDFDWAYHPCGSTRTERDIPKAVFAFYTEKYATFFALKYSS